MSVLEAADLVKMLEEKWGVSAAAPVAAVAAGPPAAAAVEEEVEEKTEFDVVLKSAGPRRSKSLKSFANLPALVWLMPRIWQKPLTPKSSKLLVKTSPTTQLPSSKKLAPKSFWHSPIKKPSPPLSQGAFFL